MTEVINSLNLDAGGNIFFARQLEHIKAKSYDVEYPELKAASLIPVSNEAGSGAETITYQQYDRVGQARLIASYADDLPRVDVTGKEFTVKVHSIGDSYGYNIQEIRASKMAGKNLEQRRANAARKAVEEKIDRIAWGGDAVFGLKGFLNNAYVTRLAADPTGTASGTTFASKGAQAMLDDLNNLNNGVINSTNGVEVPDTLLLPFSQYTRVSTTYVNLANGSNATVLKLFLEANPNIKTVERVAQLKNVGTGVGAIGAGTDVAVIYNKSADKLTLEIPQPFEQFAAQEHNLEFVIPCHARCAGVIIYYPMSVGIMEGI